VKDIREVGEAGCRCSLRIFYPEKKRGNIQTWDAERWREEEREREREEGAGPTHENKT